ncbi:response regulator transcription factor [Tessaracoccus rhinocerotis]|uniref:Response regulator transcription factor n=1 Tax=Tessaracoccus rhinocerotis TaxID=1689449 RepID=A0A553K0E8_9ACTN|nr:response regulator transcription factor [Tessaracoccus rhinocerotis]TRY18169.1 response regulator transcription factor [Tessaracoccus rhinocerotis]
MIRVVLVDDQELVRTGLRTLAEHDSDIEVVAEADNGRAGISAVREHRPDVVLMDIRMPQMDGIAATRAIVTDPSLLNVRVVVLTTFDEDENVLAAIRAGSAGYLLKDIAPTELRSAIRTVAAGDSLLSPAITRKVMGTLAEVPTTSTRPALLDSLTDREREVLARIGLGESNEEVGASLHISPATARTYVSRLLTKLSARDRSQLVILSYESGLIRPGETATTVTPGLGRKKGES